MRRRGAGSTIQQDAATEKDGAQVLNKTLSSPGERMESYPEDGTGRPAHVGKTLGGTAPEVPEEVSITEEMHRFALSGNTEKVQALIQTGASVNMPLKWDVDDGDKYATILHVLSNKPELPNGRALLEEIVQHTANINARSSMGMTPLMRACLSKHADAVEVLLSSGADSLPVDDMGRSAGHCAVMLPETERQSGPEEEKPKESHCQEISRRIVGLLADSGANLNIGGRLPPVIEAIKSLNRLGMQALLDRGSKAMGLHNAVELAPKEMVEDLLKGQASPFEVDAEGRTVLDVAFQRGEEDITALLRDFIGDAERQLQRQRASAEEDNEILEEELVIDENENEGVLGLAAHSLRPNHFRKMTTLPRAQELMQTWKQVSEEGVSSQQLKRAAKEKSQKLQKACQRCNENKYFQALMFSALISVLFLPDFWVIADVPSNDDLDIVLIIIIIIFLTELFVQSVGYPKSYIGSFFFWMDIVGLLSVPLDLSVVSEQMPRNLGNAVVMRAARMARLGARAGRFTKLVKLLRFLPGVQQLGGQKAGTAKAMSGRLQMSLSTRVSCLILVMVMVLPLFEFATYPEDDYSVKTWLNSIEFTLSSHPEDIAFRIDDLEVFYSDKTYYPYHIAWQYHNGTWRESLLAVTPQRELNQVESKSKGHSVVAQFDFGEQYRIDAICNVVLIVMIILLMTGFALLLSNSVSAIVLTPLENLLSSVQEVASKIFKSVNSIAAMKGQDKAAEDENAITGEMELLEKVIEKLAALSAITMNSSPIDAETLEQLGESDRAVFQGFAEMRTTPSLPQLQDGPSSPQVYSLRQQRTSTVSGLSRDSFFMSDSMMSDPSTREKTESFVMMLGKHLEQAGIPWTAINSWDFNILALEEQQCNLFVFCALLFNLGPTMGQDTEFQQVLTNFIEQTSQGYGNNKKVPYHNWFHAVDVTHCVFRFLTLCVTNRFLSNTERYALTVSAICHDIGHPGVNNPFLVETSHALAIRYNDHSPLENMHCAKLFEVVSQPKCAVFKMFDKEQYREMRQVCIEAILHTDNTHHFTMVKELQMLYEMNSDIFDISMQMHQAGELDFPPREVVDIFVEPEKKKVVRNCFLHFADISNPSKPFNIAKQWAWLIIDEFFLQGDMEKEQGITVQPLNDREKVNRPYSQVGFIEFFVVPFAFAAVRLLPPALDCADQLMSNLNQWCEEWVTSTVPTPDAEEQAKLQDRVAKLESKYLFRDG